MIYTFLDDEPTIPLLGAGGGVASPIQLAIKTLTNAQFIALPTTGIEIIPTPGANKIIVPILATSRLITVAGYTGDDANSWLSLDWGTTASAIYIAVNEDPGGTVELSAFLGGSIPDLFTISSAAKQYNLPGWGIVPKFTTTGDLSNKALNIKVNNNGGAGSFGGGNVANSYKLNVYYIIVS